MKKRFNLPAIAIICSILLFSCGEDDPAPQTVNKEKLSGVVQKGPFNVGTAITLSELEENLTPTGKQFTTQITSDDGSFEYTGLELASKYVILKSDGFYFNEISGENSAAQLTLFALADVSDESKLNVNVLTHLEKPRVEYLISQGSTFAEAKATAQEEVLNIFSISKAGMEVSEKLNIANSGENNAILLAISSILQGYRSVAELQEILNVIANDLKEDGTLDNEEVQGSLAGHSLYISEQQVRQNLETEYNTIGGSFEIPDFGKYITEFNENTGYTPLPLISYPETSDYGLNVLNKNNTDFIASKWMDRYYSFTAETVSGLNLKIEMKLLEGNTTGGGFWAYSLGSKENWNTSTYSQTDHFQIFTVIEPGTPAKLKMIFPPEGTYKIQIDFYEGGDQLTHSKIINVTTEE